MPIQPYKLFPEQFIEQGVGGIYYRFVFNNMPKMPHARYHDFSYTPLEGFFTWVAVNPYRNYQVYQAVFYGIPDGVICEAFDVSDRDGYEYLCTIQSAHGKSVHIYEQVPDEVTSWEQDAQDALIEDDIENGESN